MERKEAKYIPTKGMLNVRILAGIYLLYLVYRMAGGLGNSAPAEQPFIIAACVAFCVIGILLIAFSAVSLKKGKYAGGTLDPTPTGK